ncbi:hypothetical protein QBC44DRAFT_348118 [Cladorrhinum sp. PSN332]|nr:hypothetical protein QBC44DRAFT_348118 [Cladorrhinum sp. PSN332]
MSTTDLSASRELVPYKPGAVERDESGFGNSYPARPPLPLPAPPSPTRSQASFGSRTLPQKRDWAIKWFLAGLCLALIIIVAILGGVFGSRLAGHHGQESTSSEDSSGNDSENNGGNSVTQGKRTSFLPPSATFRGGVGSTSATASQPGSQPTFESQSVCKGIVCQPVLAVAQFSNPLTAFIFGRGQDNAVWYRRTNGDEWLSDWESLGGDMISQPGAASIENGIVDLFAYARNTTIQMKRYSSGSWNATWGVLGEGITSPPYVRACGDLQLEVLARGLNGDCVRRTYGPARGWTGWENHGGVWSSYPVVGCGPGTWRIAALGYKGAKQPMYVKTWLGTWSEFGEVGGDFRGSLAIASRTAEESLVFGITANLTMQYYNWTRTGESHNRLEDLGGSFQSSPVLVVTANDRLDVLAIGTDDQLKHRALIGKTWASEWQNLGGAFNSTPAVVSLLPGKISVYGLGINGTLFHGTWSMTKAFEWADGPDWLADGGPLTLEGLKLSGF